MSDKYKISDQDKQLFRQAVANIKTPSKTLNTESIEPRESHPYERFTLEDLQYIEPVSVEQVLDFHRDGVQQHQLHKLRQGKFSLEARLDLHGHSLNQAYHELTDFMTDAVKRRLRHLLIIHGKGRSGILKTFVNHYLQQQPQVLAFHSCRPQDGGVGAVYILLKRQ